MKRLLLMLPLFLAMPAGAEEDKTWIKRYTNGLIVEEFARHDKQTDGDNSFVEPESFGGPLRSFTIRSMEGWKHETDRNAIASGFLLVPVSGKYSFRTNSFYDRNQLRLDGEIVCHYMDGGERVKTVELAKGFVPIESIGFVNGRGGTQGILVEWKTPKMKELMPIPPESLYHHPREGIEVSPFETSAEKKEVEPVPVAKPDPTPPGLVARSLTVVAKDFVIEAYKNGERLTQAQRKMVLDRFGATAEKIKIDVHAGDWLVFHVAHNRLRHKGTKYFGVTGHLNEEQVGFVSRANSPDWSVCDQAAQSHEFIHFRNAGTEARAIPIARPWEEGRKFMNKYSGHEFSGDAIWGTAPSTWIKYVVPDIVSGKK